MEIEKERTVCFTGHRPNKLPINERGPSVVLSAIKSTLYYKILELAQQGYEYFVTGLAKGVDLWAAEFVIQVRKSYPNIKLIGVKPFEGHGDDFLGEDLYTYNNVLCDSDEIICLADKYSSDVYKKRNYFMVDNSSLLVAVVDNYRSGTGQTINYARKKGIPVHIINVKDYTDAEKIVTMNKKHKNK